MPTAIIGRRLLAPCWKLVALGVALGACSQAGSAAITSGQAHAGTRATSGDADSGSDPSGGTAPLETAGTGGHGTGGSADSAGETFGGVDDGGAAQSTGGTALASGGTTASGTGGFGGAASSGTEEVPAGYVPALVGVGYGGIRVVSRDDGKTWGDRAYATSNGGDDLELLRAVAYGKGLWLATGWKLVTSSDGVHWTDRGKLADGPIADCNIVEGLAYDAGFFYAACTPWNAPGTIYRSADGLTWKKYSTIGKTDGHLFLTYRGGQFVAYGDSLTSYQSSDALAWSELSGVNQATFCEDAYQAQAACHDSSWFDGVWLRADWQGKIARSIDGKTFTQVYLDDQHNTLYQSRAIAAGYVAPNPKP